MSNRFTSAERGFVTSEIMRDWIKTEFDQCTKEKANGKLRVLFLDGHSAHKTLEVIDFCCEQGIILMAFPPHTTHALQCESCLQAP